MDEQLGDPTTHDVDTLVNDPERMALVRLRLSDVSWFMRDGPRFCASEVVDR